MILLTPGPTPAPPSVLEAIAQPVAPHRTPEFEALYAQCAAGLRQVFNASGSVLTLAGSGSAAVEAAIWSFTRPGGAIIACANGKFGRRWQEAARRAAQALGARAIDLEAPWGEPIDPDALRKLLRQTGSVSAVVFVHCETSTATLSDAKHLAAVVRECAPEAVVIADGITTVGAVEVATDDWGLDVVVSASQKALGLPPGLGFVCLSARALDALRSCGDLPLPLYLDLRAYVRAHESSTTPYTPAINLHFGLAETLRLIMIDGIETRLRRCRQFADATRTSFRTMGLALPSRAPSDSVTAVELPDQLADPVRAWCRSERGVIFAGGQDEWKGRVIRMSHMGYLTTADTLAGIEALAAGLEALAPGRFDARSGVDAAHEALTKEHAA